MQRIFSRIASRSAYLMGHPVAFLVAVLFCLGWALSGPYFRYSDTWQLVVNTATTVLTFLAVFLIQNSQNRDGAAIQAKLDEILRSIADARSGFVGIEALSDEEIARIANALHHEVLQVAESDDAPTVDELLQARSDCAVPDTGQASPA